MLRPALLVTGLIVILGLLGPAAKAAVVTHDLKIGGQTMLFADTDQSGCPDATDAECSAQTMVTDGNPVGAPLIVKCNQTNTTGCALVPGVAGNQQYQFELTAPFDLNQFQLGARQTGGTFTSMDNFISGSTFMRLGNGGTIGGVQIFDRAGESTGLLCKAGGLATEVFPAKGLPFVRNLDLVNCSSCPGTACSPDSMNPTHLRVLVPLPSAGGICSNFGPNLMLRNLYIPLQNKLLVFTETDPPNADKQLGPAIDPNALGACGQVAPSMTGIGLMLAALGLLAVGSWVIGRRAAFVQSISLP